MRSTSVTLPESVGFPVTVTQLIIDAGAEVKKHAPLLSYTFNAVVSEDNDDGEERQVTKQFPARFDCPVDGVIQQWKVAVGSVIKSSEEQIVSIKQPCTHEVQFGGMCAQCGADLTIKDYTGYSGSSRAPINMAHETAGLTVSMDEAERVEKETTARLLQERKLSLVVDLDQTIIHAVVDPTVGQWKEDPSNPNYPYLQDVHKFQIYEKGFINDDWYFIKPRPGLAEFLNRISKLYECHIYTMGTRNYAKEIARMTDPDGTIFGDRILSRDESGSMSFKSIRRLFPVDTSMVVIIDDRADVWQWSRNLIKVNPFDFFPDIGDINSSFLPKKREFPSDSTEADQIEPDRKPSPIRGKKDGEDNLSTIDQLIAVSGGDDPKLLAEQTEAQEAALEQQKAARPLARKQQELDRADSVSEGDNPDSVSEEHRHVLLKSDDNELQLTEALLTRIHEQFYKEYDSSRNVKGHHRAISNLKGKGTKRSINEGQKSLDVMSIIGGLKQRVLTGAVVLFSGVIPLGMDPSTHDLVVQAKMFGAMVVDQVSNDLTHVIAPKKGTEKIRQALRVPKVLFVKPSWLQQSLIKWERQPEAEHLLEVDESDFSSTQEAVPKPMSEASSKGTVDDDDGGDNESLPDNTDFRIGIEWDEANREVDEFLGELSEESGSETDVSSASTPHNRKRIRSGKSSREASDVETEESDVSTHPISPLAKRQRLARERQSSLRNAVPASDGGEGESRRPKRRSRSRSPTRRTKTRSRAETEDGSSDVDDFALELEAAMG